MLLRLLLDDAEFGRAGHKDKTAINYIILMGSRGQIIVPSLQNFSPIIAPKVMLVMPNNTITGSRGPEGHAFCVCSVSVVDKTVGNSLCMDEVSRLLMAVIPSV